jgi:hypothetical protein
MLALRSDVGCAVLGSGRLAHSSRPRPAADPGAEFFNVADAVSAIAQKRSTRILVVTDPADKKVPEQTQTRFVQMLRQAGGEAEQFMVQATDESRHGVVAYASTVAVGCIRGASTQDLARHVERQVETRLAAKATAGSRPQGMPQANPQETTTVATRPIQTDGSAARP